MQGLCLNVSRWKNSNCVFQLYSNWSISSKHEWRNRLLKKLYLFFIFSFFTYTQWNKDISFRTERSEYHRLHSALRM